ncbi:mutator type transposase [Tanacetum coccineum]
MIDSDQFSVHEIDSMLEDLGQDGHRVMFYHFLKPGCDLDNGLEPLACDKMDYTVAKKLVLDVNNKQTSGKDLEGQSTGKELEGQSSAVGNDRSSQGPSQFVNEFYSSYDPYEESQDPNFNPFADLDLPTDRNREGNNVETKGDKERQCKEEIEGDEERQGEEEIEVDEERQGEEETEVDEERQGEEETKVEDESDSKDSDYLVDEDNNVDDVHVDMEDFEYNIDEEVEFVGCRDKEQPPDIEEGDAEEIEVLDNDYFKSASDSDDDGSKLRKRKLKQIRKQAHATEQIYKTYFYMGKEFPIKEEVKAYIKEHSIETRSQASGSKEKWTKGKITIARSPSKDKLTKEKLINGCKPNSKKQLDDNKCPWVVLVSKIKNTETWQVRTYKSVHKCLQSRTNLYATYHWYAKDLVEQLKTNPTIPVRAVQEQLQQTHELNVTQSKAFRAKQAAETKLMADYALQYKMLRDYVLELQESNPNTTVKIHVQSESNHEVPTRGPYPGQLLTAVSVDPNNGIYPLAYGLVETENTESWTWFLTQLGDDLDLYRNSNFTFVSDMQKNGTAYKELLWRAAKSTTVPDFQLAMEALKEFSNEAYEWLNQIPPQHWAKSDVLLNNMYEVFNRKLVAGRDRPIITTLEFAREYLMKRIMNVNKLIDRCDGPLTPTTTKILRSNSNEARKYTVDYARDDLYQVSGPWNDQVVVNVLARTCTCRRWELTGIPCKHVVATNWVMPLNNEASIPEEWVGRPPKERKKSAAERDVLKIVKNSKLSRERKTVTCNKCNTKGHNSRSCTGPREPKSNKRKVPSKWIDDNDAPVGSQSKKATTQVARSATSTDKGKAPTGSQLKNKGKAPETQNMRDDKVTCFDYIT